MLDSPAVLSETAFGIRFSDGGPTVPATGSVSIRCRRHQVDIEPVSGAVVFAIWVTYLVSFSWAPMPAAKAIIWGPDNKFIP